MSRNSHPEEDDLIGVSEAARILHVSADTARRYADKGLIPSTRTLTNQRRFIRSQIEAVRPRVAS